MMIKKRIETFFMAFLVLVSMTSVMKAAAGGDGTDISAVAAETGAFLLDTVSAPGISQTGGEWTVIALMRSGAAVPDSYISAYYTRVTGQMEDVSGLLSTVKSSEYSRVALAMSSIGADPRDIGGYDALAPLFDYDMTVAQGANGPIFALIALKGTGFGDEPIAQRYIEFILSRQLEDGGFALSGTISDPDTTAMALTALSYYRSREAVEDSVGRALERLGQIQRATGGFTSFSSTNSESVSQAIIALCSLGISINDERFVKNGNTLLDNLLTYYAVGKGFEHERGGGANIMATEQALCALAALWRYQTGRNTLYDMSDAPASLPEPSGNGLREKHPDINVPGVTGREIAFNDTGGNENESAIRSLAERGIVEGYSNGDFAPEREVTRAEFTAIIIRALGLGSDAGVMKFIDVPAESWFSGCVYTALEYGIVTGKSQDLFDPQSFITRQEAAVIISRAAILCGLRETFDETAIRNILSQFTDYKSIASWADEAMAFCCYFGILDESAVEIVPLKQLTRGEAAEIVFRILRTAELMQ